VRAVDIFPKIGSGYISSAADLERAFHIAKSVGFTSVGVYTDTAPGFMLHVDVRSSGETNWSRIAGVYEYGRSGLSSA